MKSPSLKAVKLLRNEIRPGTGYGKDFAKAKSFFDLIETALYCTCAMLHLNCADKENGRPMVARMESNVSNMVIHPILIEFYIAYSGSYCVLVALIFSSILSIHEVALK